MGFEKVYVTKRGLELEAKARTGKVIKILRVEVGDGELTENNMADRTTLMHKILQCEVNSLQEINNQTIINFILQQSDVEEGFYFREFGVIAEEPDTHEEVLYMYANAGNKAEYIKDKTSVAINDRMIDIVVKADNIDDMKISIDSTGIYVDRQEYQAKINSIEVYKANKKKLYEITIDTNWQGEEVPYTKMIEVEGIEVTDIVNMYPVWSEELEVRATEREEYSKISVIKSSENAIELICDEDKPTVALTVRLEVTY